MLDIEKRDYHFGLVKWFGGYNYQRDRENDFGFIQSMTGEDVFVHKNEIKSNGELYKDDLVIFEIGQRNGKTFARNVHVPSREPKVVESFLKLYLKNKESFPDFFGSYSFLSSFRTLLNDEFISSVDETTYLECLLIIFENNCGYLFNKIDDYLSKKGEIGVQLLDTLIKYLDQIGYKRVIQSENKSTYLSNDKIREFISSTLSESSDQLSNSELAYIIDNGIFSYENVLTNTSFIDYAYNDLENHKEFFDLIKTESKKNIKVYENIKDTRNWSKIFRKIVGRKVIKTILSSGVSLKLIPPDFIDEREESLYCYIEDLKASERNAFFEANIGSIPHNTILVSIITGILDNQHQILPYRDEITTILEKKVRNDTEQLPERVNVAIETVFENLDDYLKIESVRLILEPSLFKKLLYQKNPIMKKFYDKSISLQTSIEHFILVNLFFEFPEKNVINITNFLKTLWDALKKESLDISDTDLFRLFPSCGRMGKNNLSCEAFFWRNENDMDIFLCRGHPCINPQVLPNTNKHFLDFNIYDWFKHFGIDYTNEGNPSKKDFPIKLAGYFNRLKEIFKVLRCRECSSLMLPDMRYARTEEYVFNPSRNSYEKKNLEAAYRVTVFKCNQEHCPEYESTYYINHCLGFGCWCIIDSRDLKLRCANKDHYICKNCGSCCEQCEREHPNGFCPDCGSLLNLFEKDGRRFVYCSKRDCDFKISEANLPKKFLRPSAPVKKISGSSNNVYGHPTTYESEEDLPF